MRECKTSGQLPSGRILIVPNKEGWEKVANTMASERGYKLLGYYIQQVGGTILVSYEVMNDIQK